MILCFERVEKSEKAPTFFIRRGQSVYGVSTDSLNQNGQYTSDAFMQPLS